MCRNVLVGLSCAKDELQNNYNYKLLALSSKNSNLLELCSDNFIETLYFFLSVTYFIVFSNLMLSILTIGLSRKLVESIQEDP